MIVDTSALMAILLDEPDAALYARTLAGATSLAMSAATWVVAAIVVEAHSRGQGGGALDALIRQALNARSKLEQWQEEGSKDAATRAVPGW